MLIELHVHTVNHKYEVTLLTLISSITGNYYFAITMANSGKWEKIVVVICNCLCAYNNILNKFIKTIGHVVEFTGFDL